MSTLDKVELIAALRLRYDYYSAPTIFEAALAAAGLRDQETYGAAEVRSWRAALVQIGDRLGSVEVRLDALQEALVETRPAAIEPPHPPKPPTPTSKPPTPKPAPTPTPVPVADAKVEASTTVTLVGIDVAADEHVLVCGSFVDWNVDRAVVMKRSGDTWLATLPVAPSASIAFKFFRHAADGTVVWEGGDDRKLVGPRIEATWQATDPT